MASLCIMESWSRNPGVFVASLCNRGVAESQSIQESWRIAVHMRSVTVRGSVL